METISLLLSTSVLLWGCAFVARTEQGKCLQVLESALLCMWMRSTLCWSVRALQKQQSMPDIISLASLSDIDFFVVVVECS